MTTTLERPAAQPAPRPTAKPRRQWPHRLIPVAALLLGVVVLLYPMVGTWYNNYHQTAFANQYAQQVAKVASPTLQAALDQARAYNAKLSPTALNDPWAAAQAKMTPAYREYLSQLNRVEAMARIRIPGIKVDLPILHGTSDDVLAKGVGHLYGSTLPVGGPGTRAVLTGHSSLPNATMFDHLVDVKQGDVFYVDVYGGTLAYQVERTDIVLPDDMSGLDRLDGQDLVTLVTCTPYAVNSHRLLVTGHRIPYVAADDPGVRGENFSVTIESWMWPRLLGAAAALLVLLLMVIGWVRSDRARARRRALASAPTAPHAPDAPTATDR